jgi:LDH2 family malate/lactate/ureidoglycolate dehydrogenase
VLSVSETPDYPHDLSQEMIVPLEDLKDFLAKLFVKKGMFAAEAQIVVARLIEADLRGIQSHGCRAVPQYIRAMDEGHLDARDRRSGWRTSDGACRCHQGHAIGDRNGQVGWDWYGRH